MPKGLFLWQSEAGKYLKFRGPLKNGALWLQVTKPDPLKKGAVGITGWTWRAFPTHVLD